MIISEAQREAALQGIIKEVIKEQLLSEMTLKQIISTLVSQVTRQDSPTMSGIGTRQSEGFWNLKKHLSDMVRAGIQPEIEDVGFNNQGMLVVIFKTKSFEYIMTKGPEEKEYNQKLVFTDWPLLWANPQLTFQQKITGVIKGNIEMKCTCNSDHYHFGYARHSKQADIYLNPGEKVSIPAPIRNPEQFGIGCKHLALIFLPGKVKNVWGPILMQKVADLMLKQKKSGNQLPTINTNDMPFGAPEMKDREQIVEPDEISPEKTDRQPVIEPPRNYPIGPLQKTKYGDNKLLSKDDPRFGKPGYVGPDGRDPDIGKPGHAQGPRRPNIVRMKR